MGLFDKFMGPKDTDRDNEEFDESAAVKENAANTPAIPGKARKQFVLFKPETASGDELLGIADHLLNRESVIVNLELVAKDSRRFVDFLSGVSYALQGQTKRVAANTFLFTPGGIEVSGEIATPAENVEMQL